MTNPYVDAVLEDSPNDYWPLDEESGTVARSLGTGENDGVYVGPSLGQSGPTDVIDKAAFFDGVDDRVTTEARYSPGQLTIEYWLRRSTFSGNRRVWGQRPSSNTGWSAGVSDNHDSPVFTLHGTIDYDGRSGRLQDSAGSIVMDAWHHVVLTHDHAGEGTISVYVDGVLLDSMDTAASGSDYVDGWIGANPQGGSGGEWWHGHICHLAIYENKVLSPARIQAHYDAAFATADPANLAVTVSGSTASLSWDASPMLT